MTIELAIGIVVECCIAPDRKPRVGGEVNRFSDLQYLSSVALVFSLLREGKRDPPPPDRHTVSVLDGDRYLCRQR